MLIKNGILNIIGVALPALIMFPFFGLLSRELTVEQFGIFTISFSLLGYASLFDAGISRSVVRLLTIREKINLTEGQILGTALLMVTVIGVVLNACIFYFSPQLVELLSISGNLREQTSKAFKILSFAVPAMLITLVILARLEAAEEFVKFNIVRIVNTIVSVVPSVLFLYTDEPYIGAITGIVIGRVISLLIAMIFCFDNGILKNFKFGFKVLKKLFSFGGWISVSNIVSPVMVYFDRFILSSIQGADKVAFYSVSSELVTRLNIFPVAITRAAFPALSRINNKDDFFYKSHLKKVCAVILLFCFTVVPGMAYFREEIISIWLGHSYVEASASILLILLLGYFFNALSQLSVLYLQSLGISKAIAIVHICEVGPYLLLLYIMISTFGVVGAAYAWSIRVFVDFLLLTSISFLVSRRKIAI